MRLICTNCDAQYEVDAAVIPDDGRDVQCSNCGHTWFQMPEGAEEAETPLALTTPTADSAPDGTAEAAKPERRRRSLDDAVLNVLREEAERESQARKAEGTTLETQADLGLSAPVPAEVPPPPLAPRADMEAAVQDEAALVSRAAKRELLPDIEHINSTLRPSAERPGEAATRDAPQVVRMRRNDFRRGFFSSLLVALLLLGAYMTADLIAAKVPALEPALSSYVRTVDGMRLWLDARMRSTTQSLQAPAADGQG